MMVLMKIINIHKIKAAQASKVARNSDTGSTGTEQVYKDMTYDKTTTRIQWDGGDTGQFKYTRDDEEKRGTAGNNQGQNDNAKTQLRERTYRKTKT